MFAPGLEWRCEVLPVGGGLTARSVMLPPLPLTDVQTDGSPDHASGPCGRFSCHSTAWSIGCQAARIKYEGNCHGANATGSQTGHERLSLRQGGPEARREVAAPYDRHHRSARIQCVIRSPRTALGASKVLRHSDMRAHRFDDGIECRLPAQPSAVQMEATPAEREHMINAAGVGQLRDESDPRDP